MRLALAVLVFGACRGGGTVAPRPGSGSGSARTPKPPGLVWEPAVGVEGCKLGNAPDQCDTRFGPSVRLEGDVSVYAWAAHGFGLSPDNPRIHIWYQAFGAVTPFRGADAHGIGAGATVADVERVYGKSEPSKPAAEWSLPGESAIGYPDKGVRFGFLGGKLVHVMIEGPYFSSETWQEHKSSAFKHKFPPGWIVKALGVPPGGGLVDRALITSKAVSRFPDDAPVGAWILVEVYRPPVKLTLGCATPGTHMMMGEKFQRCRSAEGPPYEFSVTGQAGGMFYVFRFNSASYETENVDRVLGTFVPLSAP